jgi:alcohol dehydrogenase (cytochrome c)
MNTRHKHLLGFIFLLFPAINANAQEMAEGLEIFDSTCAHCHGGSGQGGTLGPAIHDRVLQESDQDLIAFLRTGNLEKGMPPVIVPDNQMASLLQYLEFLASNFSQAGSGDNAFSNPLASMPTIENFRPVTNDMLLNPDPADWLMYSRTYDARRSSPLDDINRDNVDQLGLAWSLGLPDGITETIPTVYDGIMYLTMPDGSIAALDATSGDLIWRHVPELERPGRSKTMSIFEDMVYFGASDGSVIAIDAVNGQQRWRSEPNGRDITSGTIVIEGKVLAGGTCRDRASCYISAHNARSGELEWKFFTAQAPDEMPGFDTWAGVPLDERRASTWGLPGGYDAETGMIYWSVANPSPYTRYERHDGNPGAVSYSAPANLYSNSTLAIDPDTGTLNWYYQHLPGDDWDEDMNQERIIFRTRVNPDPDHVKWINPEALGQERDVIVNVGEGGGLWVLDKHTGEFLWALPFPEDTENFLIEDIDVTTGATMINRDLILDQPGAHRLICYFNTRSYWPASYDAQRNSMYVPYIKNCLNMTSAMPATESMPATPQSRIGMSAPGVTPDELNGMAKVNMETGEITYWVTGPVPTTSSVLTTGGDLLFWGDINRRFRAQDLDTGEVLWETILNAPISTSNITYAVDGRQYVAVITGNNLSAPGLNAGGMGPVKLNIQNGNGNSLFVFALPE